VLDIDRDRQRISLGLKQTQSDPWQQVLESYREHDVVEGRVTKVVTFGAFVEILPGVEGLVHISELAQHHVENPREVVQQGQPVNVLILEIDAERRRLSLSLKRVEDGAVPKPRADGAESVHTAPALGLSEDVFAEDRAAVAEEAPELEVTDESVAEADEEPAAEAEPIADEPAADEAPAAEAEPEPVVDEPAAEEPAAEAEPEPVAEEPESVAEEPQSVAEEPEPAPEPVAEAEPEVEPVGAEEISPEAHAAEDLSVAAGAAPEPASEPSAAEPDEES
jgi:small subunit ribosomal protein S1